MRRFLYTTLYNLNIFRVSYIGVTEKTVTNVNCSLVLTLQIYAANEFGENYNGALRSYGQHKTHQLATMPEEQRNHVIENGIEIENSM